MDTQGILKVALLKRKNFFGTRDELEALLDRDLVEGKIYCFNSFWDKEKKIRCGRVCGRLEKKCRNKIGEVTGYYLRVTTTNTCHEAPCFNQRCLVICPAELYD